MNRRRQSRDHRWNEDGFVGGFEGLLFGTLIFVLGTLMVSYAWGVVDTKSATEAAARQAARAYVESPDAMTAGQAATTAADNSLTGFGRDPAKADVTLLAGSLARCSRVTIAVSYPAPVLDLPVIGQVGTAQRVVAHNSELVDPYEAGLPGASLCG